MPDYHRECVAVIILVRLILLFLILHWFFSLLFLSGHFWFRWW
jgi:hypothetical protein